MKYLLQADWERLVKNAERYEVARRVRFLPDLTPEQIDAEVDSELDRQADESRRANGDVDCKICGKPYWRHPKGGPLGVGDEQFLNRLCNGDLVKL